MGGGGGGGSEGVFGTVHDHGYRTFVFPNHENKQVKSLLFLMTCCCSRNSVEG